MSMLARYKKKGGFEQLLSLLEKSVPSKQEALLKNVESEDPSFAKLLRMKILTVKQVCAWDPTVIGEATVKMSSKQLSVLIKGLGGDSFERLTATLKTFTKKEIMDSVPNINPSQAEVEACGIVLIEKVREAISFGTIKIDDHNNPIVMNKVS